MWGVSLRFRIMSKTLSFNVTFSTLPWAACVGSTRYLLSRFLPHYLANIFWRIPRLDMSDSRSSLVAVVMDLNPLAWGLRTVVEQQHAQQNGKVQQRAETVVQGLDAVLTFINSFLLMTHGNQVAVIGVHPFGSGTSICSIRTGISHWKQSTTICPGSFSKLTIIIPCVVVMIIFDRGQVRICPMIFYL